jgi:hypothetical protein
VPLKALLPWPALPRLVALVFPVRYTPPLLLPDVPVLYDPPLCGCCCCCVGSWFMFSGSKHEKKLPIKAIRLTYGGAGTPIRSCKNSSANVLQFLLKMW